MCGRGNRAETHGAFGRCTLRSDMLGPIKYSAVSRISRQTSRTARCGFRDIDAFPVHRPLITILRPGPGSSVRDRPSTGGDDACSCGGRSAHFGPAVCRSVAPLRS